MITHKAVLWDLDDTLYSRREAARQLFPGMFRTCLYTGRSEAFIDEAAAYMMTRIKHNSMTHEDAFQALLTRYPADKPYVREDCLKENLSMAFQNKTHQHARWAFSVPAIPWLFA